MDGKTELTAGVFYEYTQINRVNEASERLYGVSFGFATDRTTVSVRGWMYEFSEGDEDVFASASVREDEIIRTSEFTLGGVFGLDLVDGSRVILSPRVVAAWRPKDWFKLNAELGFDNWLPSLSHEILLMPEFDPYLESPGSVREKFVTISGQAVLSRMFEVSVSLDYRNASDMVYFEDSADGYLDMMTMEYCEFFTFEMDASFWLTGSLKLFATHTLSYAYPGGDHERYPYLPRSQTTLGTSLDFLSNWTLSVELEMVGEKYTGSNSGDTIAPYETLTVLLEYNIEDYVKVYARASNLANESYEDYKGWRGYEKMFYFGIEITF
ncbi:MAG: hypothetical protein U5N86_08100 [Planctomycetota bacterium]|nr:hypothetical protein [Planctomycetota bacterium]